MNSVRSADAALLASLHYEVLTLTTTGSDFHINVMTTARKVAEEYFALCTRIGIRLFNEHFEESVFRTITNIEARKAEYAAALVRGKNGNLSTIPFPCDSHHEATVLK